MNIYLIRQTTKERITMKKFSIAAQKLWLLSR